MPRRDVFNPSKKGGASVLSPYPRGRWNVQTRATRKVAEARRKKNKRQEKEREDKEKGEKREKRRKKGKEVKKKNSGEGLIW